MSKGLSKAQVQMVDYLTAIRREKGSDEWTDISDLSQLNEPRDEVGSRKWRELTPSELYSLRRAVRTLERRGLVEGRIVAPKLRGLALAAASVRIHGQPSEIAPLHPTKKGRERMLATLKIEGVKP